MVMTKPMRILIATSTYAPARNGQAVFASNLAEGLASRGHFVTVVVDSSQRKGSQSIQNGVELVELPSIWLNIFHAGVFFTPFPGKYVRQLISQVQPDIVHVQDHYPLCRSALHTAIKIGIKTVGSNHFIPENLAPYIPGYSTSKPLIDWALWSWMLETYGRVDAIVAQSCAAADILARHGLKMNVSAISCGLDVSRFNPDPLRDRRKYQQRAEGDECPRHGPTPDEEAQDPRRADGRHADTCGAGCVGIGGNPSHARQPRRTSVVKVLAFRLSSRRR
jgi:glycosyltransferase involved in cell wall biosynthesis